jgi:CTP synthase
MSLTLVVHATPQPALYGALAAVVARAGAARLLHMAAAFPPALGADAVQHVAAEGALVPSGLLWYERLTGRAIAAAGSAPDIVAAAAKAPVVVPWHPPVQAAGDLDRLLALAHAHGVAVKRWHVEEHGDRWRLRAEEDKASPGAWWRRDEAGRLVPDDAGPDTRGGIAAGAGLCIALIGAAHDQHQVYPANLAALGDAADALGIRLDIRCVAPRAFAAGDLRGVDGVVLPGGSDMGNVPGQLAAARHTLHARIPTLGLCLGMQTMATALAQRLPGGHGANLAEADPEALVKSFVPLAAMPGLPVHRLGDQPVRVTDPQLAALIGVAPHVRCNHRFRLNPVLVPLLRDHGMRIAATDLSGQIADAIAYPAHPFYIGMQGHPEQSSRPDAPHPLVVAFLAAATAASGRAEG